SARARGLETKTRRFWRSAAAVSEMGFAISCAMLERAAVREVSGNPRGAERVEAIFSRDAGGARAAADHPPASMQVRTRLSPGGRWIRTSGSPQNFFGCPVYPPNSPSAI